MKLLYIASNPDGSPSLLLEREITEIQRRLGRVVTTQSVEMRFLLDLPIEDIATEISNYRPTILHISAHGDEEELTLANADKQPIHINGPTLTALLSVPNPPKLVYLNACNSVQIAENVAKSIPLTVGTSAPITNRAARASVVRFYELLFSGHPVQQSFENSRALLEALSEGKTTTKLVHSGALDLSLERLVEVLEVVARFGDNEKPDFQPDENGVFDVEYGVTGCPSSTSLIQFFTDDTDMKNPAMGFVRGPPIRGRYWIENGAAFGDFRIAVSGITGDGRVYAVSSSLCDALQRYYNLGGYGALTPAKVKQYQKALDTLKKFDGG